MSVVSIGGFSQNDRAIQNHVCAELASLGMPSAYDNVVVQAQRQGPDLLIRVRYLRIGVKRALTLYPTTEHRFENVHMRPRHQLQEFLDNIAIETLILVRLELERNGFKYPANWPFIHADVMKGKDRVAIAGKALTSADEGKTNGV